MTDTFAAVRQRLADAGDQALLDQLNADHGATGAAGVERCRATERAGGAPARDQGAARRSKEQLEAELSEHSAEFRAQMQPVTLEAVQAAIPDDAALVEFAVFRPFDPRAERNADAYGAAALRRVRRAPARGAARPRSRPGRSRSTRRSTRCAQALRDPTRTDVQQRARARRRAGDAAAARVARRRHAAADLAGRRAQSRAVRGAGRRAGPLPDRALRDRAI